ncbi:MAG: 4Fe-4S dicluster domain-containing protein [Desulfobacterales bacterium]
MAQRCYRKLQQHLNRMPVGYPRTISGVEIRILKRLFTPREAEIALLMDHRLETVDAIHQRGAGNGIGRAQVRSALEAMARKGAVLNVCREGEEHFALVPFVVGMFEFQCGSLSQEMYRDTVNYLKQGFALEYLSTALPQTRVIPIRRSLANVHAVATYDEIRALVERAGGRVGLAPCICRQGKDLVGQPCDRTDRREVCLVLRDLFEHGQRYGLAKALSTREALDILARNEKEGLVLQPSNEQEPQFVCSCCQCCCGLLGILNALPAPVDFVASNYRANVDDTCCSGCGVCLKRCPMSAVALAGGTARIDSQRCIGCGACIPTCAQHALALVHKPESISPPLTTDALYAAIGARKEGVLGKVKTGLRIVRPHKHRAS